MSANAKSGVRAMTYDEKAKAATIHYDRGTTYANQGDLIRAIASYTEGIRILPCAEGYKFRAVAYIQNDLLDEAIADCGEALRLEPNNAKVYETRAVAFFLKGDVDGAIADNTEAIRLDPTNALAYRNRGREYSTKGELDLAISDCTEAIHLAPRIADPYSDRGWAYFRKGEHDKALADLTEAIRLDPKLGVAYANRAEVYRALGENDKAAADDRMNSELGNSAWKPASWTATVIFWLVLVIGTFGLVYGIVVLGNR
jgi:tetratricopeptide (TPR) repeat protein